mmetsp:Transcript_68449/g.198513  ORF Transcript_68449/g.198513 Transcript_68449/m.198513 type:complete len:247 (-) Transcript_68449:80-820(-)
MGSGRKRLPEHGTIAPPSKGDSSEGRKKKKAKKIKERKESTADTTHKSSLESTATAEGKVMAQVCSTFNRLEQSRFEAFRRAAFPADAISKYVAHCLIEEHGGAEANGNREPMLSELCAPGQAEEICIVVSTLAKAYAQRLVTAARQFTDSPNQAIQPNHILRAFRDRQAKGLDPGFFFQEAPSVRKTISKDDSYDRKRMAALKVQEDFDKLFPPTPEENSETEDMEISTPERKEEKEELSADPSN